MRDLIIGIDPDKINSGLTIYSKSSKAIEVKSLKFFEIYELLVSAKDSIRQVKIECSFLIKKSNWHNNKSTGIASRIGKNVGENHQTANLLCEMCDFLDIDYLQKKPLPTKWKGADGKITKDEISKILKGMEIKGSPNSISNQDKRDSILIALF